MVVRLSCSWCHCSGGIMRGSLSAVVSNQQPEVTFTWPYLMAKPCFTFDSHKIYLLFT